jgi:hypothetical protein
LATSTGPQKAQYDRCEDGGGARARNPRPQGSEYGGQPKLAPQPQKLKLPAGKQNPANYPQESIN